MTVGGKIGAILSGRIADILGRRCAMWFSDIFCIFGWFAIAFAENALWLDSGRLSIGIEIGLISYVVPVYSAEIAPKDIRVFTTFNQLMATCGCSLVCFIRNLISWRALALVGNGLFVYCLAFHSFSKQFSVQIDTFSHFSAGAIPCLLQVLFFVFHSRVS
ncbi:sugar transporter ESL1-like [Mangifera indica]|uniref:sugar transporter ESL1-like n=1 Tax=Mangifera indica TaxID=29780 RepID=UPI001CF9FE2D|nr:sugar transporter ESL1-like [Mangifera indica]